jgi:hypothetical protein
MLVCTRWSIPRAHDETALATGETEAVAAYRSNAFIHGDASCTHTPNPWISRPASEESDAFGASYEIAVRLGDHQGTHTASPHFAA